MTLNLSQSPQSSDGVVMTAVAFFRDGEYTIVRFRDQDGKNYNIKESHSNWIKVRLGERSIVNISEKQVSTS